MKPYLVLACFATAVCAFTAPVRTLVTRFDRTTWDSVYTTAQAAHGDSLYKATCVRCHGVDLAGSDSSAPLVGKDFLGDYEGATVDQLLKQIYGAMPPDNPKSVPTKDVADIMAYLFSKNQFPAGSVPLTDNVDSLKTIKITATRPAGATPPPGASNR